MLNKINFKGSQSKNNKKEKKTENTEKSISIIWKYFTLSRVPNMQNYLQDKWKRFKHNGSFKAQFFHQKVFQSSIQV